MFVGNEQQPHRKLSRALALIASFIVVALAVILFVVAGSVDNDFAWMRSPANGIASAFLGIGVISLLYELRLRQTVEDELLRLVGIERSLASAGLAGTGDARQINWGKLLDTSTDIKVVMADPLGWLSGNWNGLIAGGDKRGLCLDLLFPDPEGDMIPLVAQHLQSTEEDIRSSINRAVELAETSWKAATREGKLTKGSQITVRWIDEFPTFSIIKADNNTIAIIPPCIGRPPTNPGFGIGFRQEESTTATSWLSASLSPKDPRVAFENKVGGAS